MKAHTSVAKILNLIYFTKNLIYILHFMFSHVIISKQLRRGVYGMSKVCAVTGKKALSGNKRSHSLHATRRKWNVNLQKVKVVIDGKPQRVRISARALKTLKAQSKA